MIPMFITMEDDLERVDGDGYPIQRHTLHVMPPVYPEGNTAEEMMRKSYEACKQKYEEVYGVALIYE